jgi:hypothetical protein
MFMKYCPLDGGIMLFDRFKKSCEEPTALRHRIRLFIIDFNVFLCGLFYDVVISGSLGRYVTITSK